MNIITIVTDRGVWDSHSGRDGFGKRYSETEVVPAADGGQSGRSVLERDQGHKLGISVCPKPTSPYLPLGTPNKSYIHLRFSIFAGTLETLRT